MPMYFILPEADIPIVHVSIKTTYDAREHYDLGVVLETMRDDNIAILGSGMSYHGDYAQVLYPDMYKQSQKIAQRESSLAFAADLTVALQSPVGERRERLAAWKSFSRAEEAVGGDMDHVMPIFVLGGAAGSDEMKSYQYNYGTHAILTSYAWGSASSSSDDTINPADDDKTEEGENQDETKDDAASPQAKDGEKEAEKKDEASANTKDGEKKKEAKDEASAQSVFSSSAALFVLVAVIFSI
jgi:hypothetical protein